jgi:hypothetical protein
MPSTPVARRRTAVRAAVLALTAAAITFGSATTDASTPSSGTVTDTSTSTAWGGGPFVVPNATAQALDAPDCSVPQSCDDYTLNVSTPAGYGLDHQLVVKVGWSNTAADFDVYLLDSAGNLVSSAASSADPEQIIVPPTTGSYTVRVVPFAPLGESYSATAALTAQPAPPAPGTAQPAGFTTFAAPAVFGDANDAGEPSIGSNWRTGATMYQAGLSTFKATFDDSVNPATASWTDVSASLTTGCPEGSTTSLDPILWTDHQTGRTIESQLSGVDSLSCTTDNDGQSWLPSMGGGIPSGVDHQTLGGGPYSTSGLGGLPISTYPNIVYYCSQDIATAFCATSRDGGTTFGVGVPTYSLLDCGGLHGHIKVGPDGTAYLPNKGCGSDQAVVVSQDNGATWTVRHVPGATPGDSDPTVGVGANNTVYFGYVGADGKPGVAVSRDHGQTWSDRQVVGGEFGIQNAVFPTMVAGDDDRAAFSWIGTPTAGNSQDAANFKGVWHLYVTSTYDGGATWQTTDTTPNDPVQRGSICTSGTTCGNDRNLLDFIDSTVDSHGRVEVGYADGCIGACVSDPTHTSGAGPADAQAAYATIARQSSGLPLFSAYDPAVTNVTISSLGVVKNSAGQFVATIAVRNAGTTPLSGLSLQLLDGRKQVYSKTGLSLAPGALTTITATWKASGGTHTVLAVADPQNLIAEADETDNKAVYTIASR